MIGIDLRWAHQHRGYIDKDRVLQYRTLVPDVDAKWWRGRVYRWSEWKDVPEVNVDNPEPKRR